MLTKIRKGFSATLPLIAILFLTACTRENSVDNGGEARLQVFLTDDPADYDAVNIDIREIRINYSSDSSSGWETLPGVQAGIYDLLQLVNDHDTLLVDAAVNAGSIQQIRLVLGSNNTIVVDGQEYPLMTPSAQQSGLKLNIHQDIEAGIVYKLLLDFDASRSVVETGNGQYILKPVIRTSLMEMGGNIEGVVVPADTILTNIFAIQGADTIAGTYTDANGGYRFNALEAGSYDLHFRPGQVYGDTVRYGIQVISGSTVVVDTMFLQ